MAEDGTPPARGRLTREIHERHQTSVIAFGGVALLFALLALVASFTEPTVRPSTDGEDAIHYGWLSLVPAGIAIVLAFTTRQVILALFLGIGAGGVIYAFGSGVPVWQVELFPWIRTNVVQTFFLPQIGSRDFAIILFVYLWCLGGLIGLWGRTGGALHFANWVGEKMVRGPRSAKFFAWVLGVVFHQGGTISTVLAGTTVRPVLDEHRVSKEEGSYIVDSTASPVATIIPFNAWPLVAGAVVAGTIPFFTLANGEPDIDKAVAFFFRALPYNFYAWFAVLLTLLLSLGLFPAIFGMRKARARVEAGGDLVRPGSEPLTSKELTDVNVEEGYPTGLADFFMPLAVLLTVAIGPYVIQLITRAGDPNAAAAEVYVVEAFFLAVIAAVLVAVLKGMPVKHAIGGIVDGAKGVTMAAIILALALTIKGVADALGTGLYVADALEGLDASMLPFLLMLSGILIAFSTGTSFGTFAVLFPVAMPLADAVLPGSETFLAVCFGAVVSGSVFGDQTSPISDTTILSSLAVGCDLMDHVTTQIPYAVIAAGAAGVLYLVLGFVLF